MLAKRQSFGFTLIEILVVVVIVGTVLSIVVLSTSIVPEDEELKTERTRMAALMEMVQDDAMMQGREFGLEIMTSSYRFVEFDPFTRQWSEVPADDLYRLRQLPEGVEFELYIDDKRVELKNDPQEIASPDDLAPAPAAANFAPHLFLFASGEASAFELRLVRPQTRNELVMRGDILGDITFGEDDDEI